MRSQFLERRGGVPWDSVRARKLIIRDRGIGARTWWLIPPSGSPGVKAHDWCRCTGPFADCGKARAVAEGAPGFSRGPCAGGAGSPLRPRFRHEVGLGQGTLKIRSAATPFELMAARNGQHGCHPGACAMKKKKRRVEGTPPVPSSGCIAGGMFRSARLARKELSLAFVPAS